MNMMHEIVKKKANMLSVLGLALMWGFGVPLEGVAQDSHAGHDHSAHADDDADEGDAKDDHSGHDHSEHSGEEEAGGLRLTPEQRKRFGIVVQPAGAGSLRSEVSLPGEIVFDEGRVVHLTPRVAGIAREIRKTVGEAVVAGEVLAVIDSRELADAKADYLAVKARVVLAGKVYSREEALFKENVSSEQDFLVAEQALAEGRIVLRSAEQKLHALGLTEKVVKALDSEHNEAITRYEILSPIDGVVTEKHISLGESLDASTGIFTIVDTRSVWATLAVYVKNLAAVRVGQEIALRVDHSGVKARGKIEMVTPFVKESTRSATARVILDNGDGRWMPGTFVTGFISASEENLPVVIQRDAIQHIEGRNVVFVEDGEGFDMAPVIVGRTDRTSAEITAGLEPGTRYVEKGAYQLKATVITSNLGSHAGHGH